MLTLLFLSDAFFSEHWAMLPLLIISIVSSFWWRYWWLFFHAWLRIVPFELEGKVVRLDGWGSKPSLRWGRIWSGSFDWFRWPKPRESGRISTSFLRFQKVKKTNRIESNYDLNLREFTKLSFIFTNTAVSIVNLVSMLILVPKPRTRTANPRESRFCGCGAVWVYSDSDL